jgi:hypothetical protein
MNREDVWLLASVTAILLVGAAYAYLIGKVGKRRSWKGRKIRLAAMLPPVLLGAVGTIASIVFRHTNPGSAAWSTVPFESLYLSGLLGGFIATKISGIPVEARPGKKNELSIR